MLICVGVLAYALHQELEGKFQSYATETCVTIILRALRVTSHLITLLNLLGLAVDHYFAIVRPLGYPILMSRRRANALIVVFWVLAGVLGLSDFYVPEPLFSYCDRALLVNYCERVFCSKYNSEYLLFALALLCFVMMSGAYAVIYVKLSQYHSLQMELRHNVRHNKRGLITSVIIVSIFVLCWLPYCLFEIVMIVSIQHSDNFFNTLKYLKIMSQIDLYLFDILLLNSILDAVVYSCRMKEVQQGYRNIMKKVRLRREAAEKGSKTDLRCSTQLMSLSAPGNTAFEA